MYHLHFDRISDNRPTVMAFIYRNSLLVATGYAKSKADALKSARRNLRGALAVLRAERAEKAAAAHHFTHSELATGAFES